MTYKELRAVAKLLFCLALVSISAGCVFAQGGQVLYNGITLPSVWPPAQSPSQSDPTPTYIASPPAVIPIDLGRQLFVDDFLIQQNTMTRTQHQPVMYPSNPLLMPGPLDTAGFVAPFSGGVWFDPADNLYKMWFYCSTGGYTCYAYSTDGKAWVRPSLPNAVVPNTDEVIPGASITVWMDLQDPDPTRKFKAFIYDPTQGFIPLYFSADGITWTGTYTSQYPIPILFDRTALFWNPFRNVWVDSLKNYLTLPTAPTREAYLTRARNYAESADLMTWVPSNPANSYWTGPTVDDPPYLNTPGGSYPQLYNLDAVAYESVTVGLFSWFYPGPGDSDPGNLPGPDIVEVGVGFSRDGYQWVRPTRGSGPGPGGAFIAASNVPGTWNMGNTQSSGGGFLVVGDELWFYFSGRNGQHGDPSVVGGTGLATLRRDGFYSMDAGSTAATLTTRPVQFSGKYLFVNVNDPSGLLQVQVLNPSNGVVLATSAPLTANKTLQPVSWTNGLADLSSFANQPVQFQFTLTNGELYSFWVSASQSGASNGYVAAGGPGFITNKDTLGSAAYPTATATPEISPAGGAFRNSTTVTIFTGTPSATIYYATDGSTPSASSPVYTGPFQLTASATVKALAIGSGLNPSAVTTAVFTQDNTAPTVFITNPSSGQTIAAGINLTASASDAAGISNVQFLVDGGSVGTVTTAPYTILLETTTLSNGTHSIIAQATDSVGNQGTSAPVSVTVQNVTSGPTSGLAAYWSFDSAYVSGTSFFDQSGNDSVATASNITSIPGVTGQAIQFNGSTSVVQVLSSTTTQLFDLTSDLSLSLWVQTTNSSRDEALISKYAAGGNGYGYLLRTTPQGTAELLLGGANVSSGSLVATDVTKINDGNWHHLAVVISLGNTVTFYVDGVFSSTSSINTTAGTAASFFQLGLNPLAAYGNYFTGAMDEVRVYGRAVSATEVAALADYISVSPPSVALYQAQTQQFTATLEGAPAPSIAWSINPSVGSIAASGLYTAPASISISQSVTVLATSTATNVSAGIATVNLTPLAVANFVNSDATTQGSWIGVYGGDGYSLSPSYQVIPPYAALSMQNQFSFTYATDTSDVRALRYPDGVARFASTWYNGSSFSFDINFGSTLREFALYALDWDNQGRAETVQILDATSGSTLSTQTISNFSNGIYLVWNISGHVKVIVTLTSGPNAVVSGVFFGGPTGTEMVTATSGALQIASTNTAFAPLVAVVTSGWNPVANATVTFTAPASGASGTFAGGTNTIAVTTNAQGVATSPVFTANSAIGGPYMVAATVSGVSTPANFSLTNVNPAVGPPASITATSGASQNAVIETAFGGLLEATVKDAQGNLISNAAVTFTAPTTAPTGTFAGGLSVSTVVTNNLGVAIAPILTAGAKAGGPYTVTAVVSGVATPATFSLTNNVGAPNSIVTVSGSGQTAMVNTAFANPLVVNVTDIGGNAVANTSVAFTGPASGAGVSFGGSSIATVTTNASGQATSPSFSANAAYGGPYTVAATVAGVATAANFSLTNTAIVQVTVTTSTSGPTITVDNGTPFTGTQTFTWLVGSGHTLTTSASQSIAGVQYTFLSWSDGGALSHSITAPALPVTYTASFGVVKASFISPVDTATQGNWEGKYGLDGSVLANGPAPNIPSYASFSVKSALSYTWDPSPSDPRALLTGVGSARLAAAWYNVPGFNFDVNFSDGNSHEFALYALDWDSKGRAETVQILNASTGAVLDTENISNFSGGTYLAWNITGHVTVVVTVTSGPNAAVSGVFFGGAGGSGPETVTVTPANITLTAGQQQTFQAAITGTSNTSQTVTWAIATVNPTTAPPGTLNPTTGAYTAPATGTISAATLTIAATDQDGVKGTTTLTLNPGAVGGANGATFVKTDTTTSGSWQGVYGTDGYSIANAGASLPTYDQNFGPQNQINYTWLASTSDSQALQYPGNAGRIASAWYNPSTFSFAVNFTDGQTHQLALYALDWDASGRVETIQIQDGVTGVPLDTRTVSNFSNGAFLVWNISGNVKIVVTKTAGANAVISGAFFGTGSGNGGGGTGGPEVVTVTPSNMTLTASQQQTFAATISGASNTTQTISWGITAVSPSNAASGTLSASTGVYTAPASGSIAAATVTITATDQDGITGTATVTLNPGSTGGGGGGSNSAAFVKTDIATSGNWQGKYGSDGYSIANLNPSLPSYASNFTPQSQLNYTWNASTSDTRALQNPAGGGGYASTWYNPSTFSLKVNFTDGQTHQLALYALDWDNAGRAETIQIQDGVNSAVLDTRTVSNFSNGAYLVWNISGSVKIVVTGSAGPNAVISGAFFGPGTGGGATGPEVVTVTPSSTTFTAGQQQTFTAAISGTSNTSQTITWSITAVTPTNAAPGTLNPSTGTYTAPPSGSIAAATVTITATDQDAITGTATFTLNSGTTSGGNAAAFIRADTTTSGSWIGKYGSDGYMIANLSTNLPAYASSFAPQNQLNYTWLYGTSDPRALQIPGAGSGIASAWYNPSSFDFVLNITDGQTHQFALYFLDWDISGRAESVQIQDGVTGVLLDSRTVANFNNGAYLVWNISGNVKIVVTNTAGANAAVSGAFFK